MRAVVLTGLALKPIPPGFITLESGPRSLWKPGFIVLSRLEECPRGTQVLRTRIALIDLCLPLLPETDGSLLGPGLFCSMGARVGQRMMFSGLGDMSMHWDPSIHMKVVHTYGQ